MRQLAQLGHTLESIRGFSWSRIFKIRLKLEGQHQIFLERTKTLFHTGTPSYLCCIQAAREFGFVSKQDELKRIRWLELGWIDERQAEQALAARQENRVVEILDEIEDRMEGQDAVSFADEVRWVYQHFGRVTRRDTVTGEVTVLEERLKEAPSPGAAALLRWAVRKQDHFFGQLLPKILAKNEEKAKDGDAAGKPLLDSKEKLAWLDNYMANLADKGLQITET